MKVQHTINLTELLSNNSKTPLIVQIRLELNKAGFKFEDDGSLSSIINEEPKPLGRFCYHSVLGTQNVEYTQIIN